ncbi:L(+)-tartrate dehydratase subunit alpha [Veillonella montpellierensis]|uniref:L(+)-tartrate dehydratase subunit alpha n=1 Tax=Veillonella montpellierensis TaxID=187328 RepID=UPI0003FA0B1D|nr:L(+)-tartrate dehydratase subunit alpha [Veillonella montpellierensis]
MSDTNQLEKMTHVIAEFVAYMARKLPDDVESKIKELASDEKNPLARTIYETMKKNMELAMALKRPSCQDTGVLQYWVKCGAQYPFIGELESILRNATYIATKNAPLRHNCVETFDEYNTGKNIGTSAPYIMWDIIPNRDDVEIFPYMAGGGCSLPGSGKTLMPGEGYEGVAKFVLDLMTSYGLNACPPLLVGVGVATSIDTAALFSKKALMRPVSSRNENEKTAYMEDLLTDGINALHLGPQGMGGSASVLGVNIERGARHPSVISVAVNVGCWNHRRGHIIFNKDGSYKILSHSGVTF